jgi:hypothetical protein
MNRTQKQKMRSRLCRRALFEAVAPFLTERDRKKTYHDVKAAAKTDKASFFASFHGWKGVPAQPYQQFRMDPDVGVK